MQPKHYGVMVPFQLIACCWDANTLPSKAWSNISSPMSWYTCRWLAKSGSSVCVCTHTHIQTQALQVSISTLSQHLLQQLVGVIDHRCVRPVGVVEGEVLDAVFWLLGVGDTCREETAVTGFRWHGETTEMRVGFFWRIGPTYLKNLAGWVKGVCEESHIVLWFFF